MSDLTDFLLARIKDDEESADCVGCKPSDGLGPYSPARVLAECEAKRRIVELHSYEWMGPDDAAQMGCVHDYEPWPCPTLRLLALPYADHPDYRPEWTP